jgi:hypothetical protein
MTRVFVTQDESLNILNNLQRSETVKASSTPRGSRGTEDDPEAALVVGGARNEASTRFATVMGGFQNKATEIGSVVGGGGQNIASGVGSVVGGGQGNVASGAGATVAGGAQNEAVGRFSTVGGGVSNVAVGNFSTIPGGSNNAATGACSLAMGSNARALHAGSIVLNAAACDGRPVSRVMRTEEQAAACQDSTKFDGFGGSVRDCACVRFCRFPFALLFIKRLTITLRWTAPGSQATVA